MRFLQHFAAVTTLLSASASLIPVTPRYPPSTPSHLKCSSDADCAVRNVGNCCGYYPQCANVDAELPPACPDGEPGAGICGFPVIEACACSSKGSCMAV
ncbi:hypothetical protein LIA77_08475 [Sarocladium implicatum]|nr:hypothetical protein LIA77_08475 [Sarocladium implicatum]